MAEAMISGFIESKIINPKRIIATDLVKRRLNYISNKYKIKVSDSNIESIKLADIIIIAVKPQHIENLLKEISGYVKSNQLIISVCTGVSTKYLEKYLGQVAIVRVMPNTPALINEGMLVFCPGKFVKKQQDKITRKLLNSVGTVIKLPEKFFDTVTAVSGSGPAYLFYLAEGMVNSAKRSGFNEKNATLLVNQTLYGASKMLKITSIRPEILRQKVTSPGGTTEQAIRFLKQKKFLDNLINAVNKAKKRAGELRS